MDDDVRAELTEIRAEAFDLLEALSCEFGRLWGTLDLLQEHLGLDVPRFRKLMQKKLKKYAAPPHRIDIREGIIAFLDDQADRRRAARSAPAAPPPSEDGPARSGPVGPVVPLSRARRR